MRLSLHPLIRSTLLSALIFACTSRGPGKDRSQEALAWVNDQPILKQRLIHEVVQAGFRSPDEIEKVLRNKPYVNQIMANLITEELLYQEAVRRSIHPSSTMPHLTAPKDAPQASPPDAAPSTAKPRDKKRSSKGNEATLRPSDPSTYDAKAPYSFLSSSPKGDRPRSEAEGDEVNLRRRLIAALVEKEVDPKISVTDGEVYSNYTQHLDEFRRPGTVRARQILVSTREEALEILQVLKSGMDFASVARERSVSPDAESGGDLGYFSADETQPEIARACFDLPVGGISREVESPYGFHVFQVVDKAPPRTLPLDEVRDSITARLRKEKRETIYRNWLADLRKKAKIRLK